MANFANWFAEMWPFVRERRAVIADVIAIGAEHKHFLADLALRGGVFHSAPIARDLYQAGVMEGRRQVALETIKLCRVDPQLLWQFVATRPTERSSDG
jgi:hypothetical protein